MKQILQNLGTGETLLAEIPCPRLGTGKVLIQTQRSLVSIGTEKMLLDFGRANLLQKARQQPEKVKQVIQKVKSDGIKSTVEAVRGKLDKPIPLGYSNVGRVIEVADGLVGLSAGDLVVSAAPHAEMVCAPRNLCARIPEGVSAEAASFTVVASIGLQGVRLLDPNIGETVVVTGLGLIGLLVVQILIANGCKVIGIDFDSKKCRLAENFGASVVDLSEGDDPLVAADAFTGGRGVDGVIITASTKSSDPVSQAATMCRKRGKIVLVGVTGLQLNRSDFYEKELSFQVSCSYGAGRYDPEYEDKGRDYPFGYVRWTEQRNFEAVLDLMNSGSVKTESLVSHRYSFEEALTAYDTVGSGGAMGIILEYSDIERSVERIVALPKPPPPAVSSVVVGVVGAGNFAGQVLLPALAETGARLKTILSGSGVSGTHLGKKFGFENSSTEANEIFEDEEINLVIVTTQHNTHARFVLDALRKGKRVFVEKPLCLNAKELAEIESVYKEMESPYLMVGFNRRFAPHVVKMKSLLSSVAGVKAFVMTVNAGEIPLSHWTQDKEAGGGRLIGEGCHFIDLLRFLADSPIKNSSIVYAGGDALEKRDTFSISLTFENGSIGTVHYFATGSKSFPKECLEVFSSGRVLRLENFRKLEGFGWPGFKKLAISGQDKGHTAEMKVLVNSISKGEPSPIPFEEIVEVTATSNALDRVE